MHAWLENQIGQSAANIITSLVVLFIVVAAIAATISILRKFNGGTFVVGGKSRTPRLSVRDAAAVDRTRRLVLVRRDNVEHLIMIGGPTDLVIETNIQAAQPVANQDKVVVPANKLHPQLKPVSAYREPSITPSLAADKDTKINDEVSANEQRFAFGVATPPNDFGANSRTKRFSQTASQLNVSPADEDIGLSQDAPGSTHQYREPFVTRKNAPSLGGLAHERGESVPLPRDFTPSVQNETFNPELGARREPSLNVPSPDKKSSGDVNDDLDLMFGNNLKQTIKNEKI